MVWNYKIKCNLVKIHKRASPSCWRESKFLQISMFKKELYERIACVVLSGFCLSGLGLRLPGMDTILRGWYFDTDTTLHFLRLTVRPGPVPVRSPPPQFSPRNSQGRNPSFPRTSSPRTNRTHAFSGHRWARPSGRSAHPLPWRCSLRCPQLSRGSWWRESNLARVWLTLRPLHKISSININT